MPHSNYIIAGGAEGKERLAVLGNVLNAGTLELLRRLHPAPLGSFLDLGCGPGTVAIAVAASGQAGQVTGMDFDADVLDLARQDARAAGLTNITFTQGDATSFETPGRFDAVYARFLLSHLTNPLHTLTRMANAARPGGLVLVEDIDFSGHYCAPANAAFAHYLELFVAAARHNGQDPNIGLRLFGLFREAGLSGVGFSVRQPVFSEGPGKWMGYYTLDKIRGSVLRQGLATEGALQATLDELKAFTADPHSLISLPRIFQVWGIKKR